MKKDLTGKDVELNGTRDDGVMRAFDTGATRDTAEGKLDPEGFTHPKVMEQYYKYMNMNRLQSDGKLRDSDNWQKGIDMTVYMKSLTRHYQEMWQTYRTHQRFEGSEMEMSRDKQIEYMSAMCGIVFNIQGFMLEWLKKNPEVDFDGDEPTAEMRDRVEQINDAYVEEVRKDMDNMCHYCDDPVWKCDCAIQDDDEYCEECGYQECECPIVADEFNKHGGKSSCECGDCTCQGEMYTDVPDPGSCATCRWEDYGMHMEPCHSCCLKLDQEGICFALWMPKL